jgi:hypothetical protein
MFIAAPLTGKGETPITIWSGFTGQSKGEYGEERINVVIEEKLDDGVRIIVGEQRNDVTMCGRPAIVAAKEIDPATLTLKRGTSVQSLSETDRAGAVKLSAKPVTDPRPLPVVSLLRAQTASSAVGKAIGTLTDGDVETSWSENKSGIGRGEFASMSSSSDIAISSLEVVVRPPTADVPDGVAPKKFYLATPDKLFEVTLPEDAWRKAGARFEISLPSELSASCLSLVLEFVVGRSDVFGRVFCFSRDHPPSPLVRQRGDVRRAARERDERLDGGQFVCALFGGNEPKTFYLTLDHDVSPEVRTRTTLTDSVEILKLVHAIACERWIPVMSPPAHDQFAQVMCFGKRQKANTTRRPP